MIATSGGVGTGSSAYKAATEACMQALLGLPEHKADVLIVFGSVSLDQDKLIEAISKTSPGSLIVGCSTAGELSSEGFATEKSVVVLAITSDQMKFWGGVGHHILWNPHRAGEDCMEEIEYESRGYISSALVFLDVISGNGDQALLGATERLGNGFPLWGGAASDDLLFFETYQYYKDKAYSGSIVGLGLSGDFHAAGAVMHGFLPVGVARKVTKSKDLILEELDGKPASSIYQEYFGEEHLHELHEGLLPSLAISYPLGIFLPESNDVILRNPVSVDKDGTMKFTSPIPLGAEVRLMISDIEQALETAELAAKKVLEELGGRQPKAIIVISSIARKKMLGAQANDEIAIIQRVFGRDVPIVGYYSYGQVGGSIDGQLPFHNGSILIWALAE